MSLPDLILAILATIGMAAIVGRILKSYADYEKRRALFERQQRNEHETVVTLIRMNEGQ